MAHNGFPQFNSATFGLLPVPDSRWVGRQGELSRLPQMGQESAAIVLSGPPGIGKRQLALRTMPTQCGNILEWPEGGFVQTEEEFLKWILSQLERPSHDQWEDLQKILIEANATLLICRVSAANPRFWSHWSERVSLLPGGARIWVTTRDQVETPSDPTRVGWLKLDALSSKEVREILKGFSGDYDWIAPASRGIPGEMHQLIKIQRWLEEPSSEETSVFSTFWERLKQLQLEIPFDKRLRLARHFLIFQSPTLALQLAHEEKDDPSFRSIGIRARYALGDFEGLISLLEDTSGETETTEVSLTRLSVLGLCYRANGQAERALETQKKFLEQALWAQHPGFEGEARWNLAMDHFRAGRYEDARSENERALPLLKQAGDFYRYSFGLLNGFAMEIQLQNVNAAWTKIYETERTLASYKHPALISFYLRQRAWMEENNGSISKARAHYEQALKFLSQDSRNSNQSNDAITARIELLELEIRQRRTDSAAILFQELHSFFVRNPGHFLLEPFQNLQLLDFLLRRELKSFAGAVAGMSPKEPRNRVFFLILRAEAALQGNEIRRSEYFLIEAEKLILEHRLSPFYFDYPVIHLRCAGLYKISLRDARMRQIDEDFKKELVPIPLKLRILEVRAQRAIQAKKMDDARVLVDEGLQIARSTENEWALPIFELLSSLIQGAEMNPAWPRLFRSRREPLYEALALYGQNQSPSDADRKRLSEEISSYERVLLLSFLPGRAGLLEREWMLKTPDSLTSLFSEREWREVVSRSRLSYHAPSGVLRGSDHKSVPIRKSSPLLKILEVLMRAFPSEVPLETLFQEVWGGRYNPIIHNTKIYTSVNRLRKSIEPNSVQPQWIVFKKNGYGLSEKCRFAYAYLPGEEEMGQSSELLLGLFRKRTRLTRAEIRSELHWNDTKIKRQLRALLAQDRIARFGEKKGTYYRLA